MCCRDSNRASNMKWNFPEDLKFVISRIPSRRVTPATVSKAPCRTRVSPSHLSRGAGLHESNSAHAQTGAKNVEKDGSVPSDYWDRGGTFCFAASSWTQSLG